MREAHLWTCQMLVVKIISDSFLKLISAYSMPSILIVKLFCWVSFLWSADTVYCSRLHSVSAGISSPSVTVCYIHLICALLRNIAEIAGWTQSQIVLHIKKVHLPNVMLTSDRTNSAGEVILFWANTICA